MKIKYKFQTPKNDVEVVHDTKTGEVNYITAVPGTYAVGLSNLLNEEQPLNVGDSINFDKRWDIVEATVLES
ncbi:hypothetical protein L4D76_00500 [Photobacterium sagamiensis]|uniref:hypothetical protein n=1 Tax=Photobacterium sagamiensis TaxID=2910241 RepID=UPI003D12C1EB